MTPTFLQEFAALPSGCFADAVPHPVSDPKLIALNRPLAVDLGLDPDWLATEAGISMLVGNSVPAGVRPLAQIYGGHQFGTWVPRLGDGRAILLGELQNNTGEIFELQLKGAGPTAYSRNGDGRYALGPALREYIVSEAMYALGVPTTRALCVIETGDKVYRERPLPGAVLVRIAASHLRVGTFQYFAARKDQEVLSRLVDFAIKRHFSAVKTPLELFTATIHAQASLIAKWMSVGFVHGVMNTDNMTLSGQTIDYGPCAFLDEYHPLKVFSSIDQTGRYAFNRQADIGLWNLGQLANALLPLFDADQNSGIKSAQAALEAFPKHFNTAWLENFAAKLGITNPTEADRPLIIDILSAFSAGGHDFTRGFRSFPDGEIGDSNLRARWAERSVTDAMNTVNPAIIPRNHQIERAIKDAMVGDFTLFHRLNTALKTPFSPEHDHTDIAAPPAPSERITQTFCGT